MPKAKRGKKKDDKPQKSAPPADPEDLLETPEDHQAEQPDEQPKDDINKAEIASLKKQLAEQAEQIAELLGKKPAKPVAAIGDEELSTYVTKAGELLFERNLKLKEAEVLEQKAEFAKKKAVLAEATALELEALPLCAKAACVGVDDIISRSRRVKGGKVERFNYAINIRNGLLRIVLNNGSRLKIDVADLDRAKWDYVHDKPGMVGPNKRPARWQNRPQKEVLRG